MNRKNREPIKEIFPKLLIADCDRKVAMRCRYDPHIDCDRPATTDAFYAAFFKDAQKFHLHVGRHIADFVEKKCASARFFKAPLPLGIGASEAALFMPEQLAFEQVAWNGTAVNCNERPS